MLHGLVVASLVSVDGHGTMNYPPPRNPSGSLWFTEGAAIGCDKPAGYVAASKWHFGWSFCEKVIKPTLSDPTFKTYKQAPPVTPWHAPGHAPVYSPCGLAGGGYEAHPENGGVPPPGFDSGDDGLGLPPLAGVKPPVWPVGSKQEVWWNIAANHGGGYSYRLCPISQPLTESCFQKHVLLAGFESWIVYGGHGSKNRTTIVANRTTEGTHPAGSQWTKVPIPSCDSYAGGGLGEACLKPIFPTPVPGLWGNGPDNSCAGQPESGHTPAQRAWCSKKMDFSIVDKVIVPADLAPGDYMLSFRWDCEQTPQIWSQCADVTVTAPGTLV